MEALYGLLLPFLGTSLGAASVFFMKKAMSDGLQKGLTGFAAGVMTAASVWSLLIPAIERSEELGKQRLKIKKPINKSFSFSTK